MSKTIVDQLKMCDSYSGVEMVDTMTKEGSWSVSIFFNSEEEAAAFHDAIAEAITVYPTR